MLLAVLRNNHLLFYKDILTFPFYVGIAYLIVTSLIIPKFKEPWKRKVFLNGFYLRIFATIAFALIHHFYYGGDTGAYTRSGSMVIWHAFLDDPITALSILFQEHGTVVPDTYLYTSQIVYWHGETSVAIIKISAIIGFFCFHSYSVIAFVFSMFCYSGLWKVYEIFVNKYPGLRTELAITILYFPSVLFWGSGVMKDPLTLGALGWAFYAFHDAFVKRKSLIINISILIGSLLLMKSIKTYFVLCFVPAALGWLFIEYNAKIYNSTLRLLSKPLFIVLGVLVAYFGADMITEDSKRYSLENVAETAAITANYVYRMGMAKDGSVYYLGELDGTMSSLVSIIPSAINVTLFRPYIWEVKNIFMLVSALESMFVIYLTLTTLFKVGFFKTFKSFTNDPLLIFCFVFSMVFAFGAGATSFNFGSLARYKIPVFTFYLSALYIIQYRAGKIGKKRNVKTVNFRKTQSSLYPV